MDSYTHIWFSKKCMNLYYINVSIWRVYICIIIYIHGVPTYRNGYIYIYIHIFVPNGCPNVFDIPIYIFMVPAPIAILSNLITLHEHVWGRHFAGYLKEGELICFSSLVLKVSKICFAKNTCHSLFSSSYLIQVPVRKNSSSVSGAC